MFEQAQWCVGGQKCEKIKVAEMKGMDLYYK